METAAVASCPPRSPELLRCKRRLSFSALTFGLHQHQHHPQHHHHHHHGHHQHAQPGAVARRNERERNRVKQVNLGFQTLRQHVPSGGASRRMSKVETLRSAVEYIRALQQLLDEHDAVSAAFRRGVPSPALSSSSSSSSASSSDEGVLCEQLSSEEQELLDFATWFDRY